MIYSTKETLRGIAQGFVVVALMVALGATIVLAPWWVSAPAVLGVVVWLS